MSFSVCIVYLYCMLFPYLIVIVLSIVRRSVPSRFNHHNSIPMADIVFAFHEIIINIDDEFGLFRIFKIRKLRMFFWILPLIETGGDGNCCAFFVSRQLVLVLFALCIFGDYIVSTDIIRLAFLLQVLQIDVSELLCYMYLIFFLYFPRTDFLE